MGEKGGKRDEGNPEHRWGYDVTLVTDTVEGQRLSETEALAEEMNKLARLSDSRSVRENSFARYPYVILFLGGKVKRSPERWCRRVIVHRISALDAVALLIKSSAEADQQMGSPRAIDDGWLFQDALFALFRLEDKKRACAHIKMQPFFTATWTDTTIRDTIIKWIIFWMIKWISWTITKNAMQKVM